MSLRTRVATNVVAVTAVIQVILGVVVYQYFRSTVDEFFETRLATRVRWAATELTAASSRGVAPSNTMLETLSDRTIRQVTFNTLVLVIRDASGRVVATSDANVNTSNLPPPPPLGPAEMRFAMAPMDNLGNSEDEKFPARTATLAVTLHGSGAAPHFLTGAISNAAASQMNELVGRAVLLASVLGLLATGCAGWFITGLALKPLEQLSTVAREFSLERINQPAQSLPQIPELSKLTDELEAARGRIRLALQANERFIANVSHELKTPVAVLRAEAQNLDATDLPPESRAFVRSVIEETRRLGMMVDSFLTLAAVRSGRELTVTKPAYLNDVLVESLAHSAGMAKLHNVTLLSDLYDGDNDLVVAGDAHLLRVLFDNLLRNAVRFSPSGSSVRATIVADANNATVSVVDSGPGIPDDLLPTIFERFSKASPVAPGRGHGLGLSIAQGIAELHGGLISTTNLPAGGCRFVVVLPRQHTPRAVALPSDRTGSPPINRPG
ncbi:MAG: HAMP domain-containing sensor histidine kinase [Phycisphaerales bacterium]|nr:HAMP domain-containing sensor histidine kinase [Phycisphaerales bacterium]